MKPIMLWIVLIVLCTGCGKPPDEPIDCDCGIVLLNTNNSIFWTTVVQNNCSGVKDTTIWPFPMDDCWQVGTIICKLPHVEIPIKNIEP